MMKTKQVKTGALCPQLRAAHSDKDLVRSWHSNRNPFLLFVWLAANQEGDKKGEKAPADDKV